MVWFLNFDHTEGPSRPAGVTEKGDPYPGAIPMATM